MKRSFTLIYWLLSGSLLFAQLPPNQPEQDCFGAIPLCQNTYFQPNAYQGRGSEPDEINGTISCMILGERNSVWYIFRVETPGNLCFTITPVDTTDDYDWAVYNLTNASCAQIGNNPALEVACNFTYNTGCAGETGPNGRTDCPGQFEPCIPVQAGETYVLNVSNFNASNAGYTIDFSQSDATLFDGTAPEIQSVTSFCTGVEVTFTENVLCSSVDPTDFSFSGPDGPYTISQVSSEQCDDGGNFDRTFRLIVDPPIQQAGTYQLELVGAVNDFCGNGSGPDSWDVYMPLPPTAAIAPVTPQCQESNLFTFEYTGPSQVSAYQWNFGDGGSSIVRQPQYRYQVYGDLEASLIITDVNGCQDTATTPVTVHPAPVAVAEYLPPSCEDDTLRFRSLSRFPDATQTGLIWNIGDGTNTSQEDFFHPIAEPGNYLVMLRVTNNFGCIDTASYRVPVYPKPEVDFSTQPDVCLGETATLNFLASIADLADDEIVTWTWDLGDSTRIDDAMQVTHLYQTGGPQPVTLTVTSDKGCADSLTQDQMIYAPEPPVRGPDTVCFGETAFLTAVPEDGGVTYWYHDLHQNKAFWEGAAYPTTPVVTTQTFYVEQVTKEGCLSPRAPIEATIHTINDGYIQMEDSLLSLPVALGTFRLGGSVPGANFHWQPEPGVSLYGEEAVHQYTHPGRYQVKLFLTDRYGCGYDFSTWVEVLDPTRLLVPSAFTPNDDGINDRWQAIQAYLENFELRVFNRQGRVVFESRSPDASWDGRDAQGRPLPEGVYVYAVSGIDAQGNDRNASGTITLIR